MASRKLTDHDLIKASAAGRSITEIAGQFCVGERQVYRRLAKPQVRQAIRDMRNAVLRLAAAELASAATSAIRKLAEQVNADDAKIAQQAAKAILTTVLPIHQAAEFADRLEELEDRMQEITNVDQ